MQDNEPMTPTHLRTHVYEIIDRVLQTGQPCRVRRGDQEVLIVPANRPRRNLDNLPQRTAFVGTCDELVNFVAWEWRPDDKA